MPGTAGSPGQPPADLRAHCTRLCAQHGGGQASTAWLSVLQACPTLLVKSSTAVVKVCMPPMAVPMSTPQRLVSRSDLASPSQEMPAC